MNPVDYVEVLADLERRKGELEAAINAIRRLVDPTSPAALSPVYTPMEAGPRAFPFLGMTIPEATIAHLRAVFLYWLTVRVDTFEVSQSCKSRVCLP